MATVIVARSGPKQQFNSPITLFNRYARKTNGYRKLPKSVIKEIILGQRTRVDIPTMDSNTIFRSYRAKASKTRMNIGCHVISGQDFKVIKEWALNG